MFKVFLLLMPWEKLTAVLGFLHIFVFKRKAMQNRKIDRENPHDMTKLEHIEPRLVNGYGPADTVLDTSICKPDFFLITLTYRFWLSKSICQ